MSRINLKDSLVDIIANMSDGIPGSIMVMMNLCKHVKEIDPQNIMAEFGILVSLDHFGIYGSGIGILWKDKCNQDTRKMIILLRSVQLGFLDVKKLREMSKDQSRKINLTPEEFEDLDKKVCKQLKEFKKPESWPIRWDKILLKKIREYKNENSRTKF